MILNKISNFFEKNNISLKGKKICVCFSGGADSVALLSAMNSIKEEKGFYLCAIHVNHHIRGNEADEDEAFCKSFCEKKGILFISQNVYAVEEAKNTGVGLEVAGRKLRYEVFAQLKETENIDYFLTAHHANDTAETILFNVLRGCSVSGLVGIPHVRDFYLRPLIDCTKEEILEYISLNGEAFVTDSTNLDQTYTRNYIRRSLFPAFERVNSNYLGAILRLSESAAQDEDYFAKELDKITSETNLSLLHPSVSSRYICKEYEKLSAGEGLPTVNVKQIMSCLSSTEEKCINLPFGINAYVKNGKVVFIKRADQKDEKSKTELDLTETILVSSFSDFNSERVEKPFLEKSVITVCKKYVVNKSKRGVRLHPTDITINGEKIEGSLFVRKRQEGDTIFCRGMTRSVNKEFMNLKIPKHLRDYIPVICDEKGVVFVPFIGADDRVYLREKNGFSIYISVRFVEIAF